MVEKLVGIIIGLFGGLQSIPFGKEIVVFIIYKYINVDV